MKKLFIFAFGLLLALTLAACNGAADEQNQMGDQSLGGGSAQIPNPFVDCKTLEEAGELAGFTVTLPEKMPEGYALSAIRAIRNEMIEVIYTGGDGEIRIRKGSGSEDISGDYNEYKEISTVSVGSVQVTMKGNSGKVSVATWTDGQYAYAITLDGAGMDQAVISGMVGSIR